MHAKTQGCLAALVSGFMLCALLGGTGACLSGCGGDPAVFVVVPELPEGTKYIRKRGIGRTGAFGQEDLDYIPNGTLRFRVLVPGTIDGSVHIEIDALDEDHCVLAHAETARESIPSGLRSWSEHRVDSWVQRKPARCELKVRRDPGSAAMPKFRIAAASPSGPASATSGSCQDEYFPDGCSQWDKGSWVELAADGTVAEAAGSLVWSGESIACGLFASCRVQVNKEKGVDLQFQPFLTNSAGWTWRSHLPQGNSLNAVWGSSPDKMWAVGDVGTVMRYQGGVWTAVAVPTSENLFGVWGTDDESVWIVGTGGTILHYEHGKWEPQMGIPQASFLDIWGRSAADLWVVGGNDRNGTIMHRSGTTWTQVRAMAIPTLYGVTGFEGKPGVVWVAGENRTIFSVDASSVTPRVTAVDLPMTELHGASRFRRIVNSGPNEIAVAGPGVLRLRLAEKTLADRNWQTIQSGYCPGQDNMEYAGLAVTTIDGSPHLMAANGTGGISVMGPNGSCSNRDTRSTVPLRALWADSKGAGAWAVGDQGTILSSVDTQAETWKKGSWTLPGPGELQGTLPPLYGVSGAGSGGVVAIGNQGVVAVHEDGAWKTSQAFAGDFFSVWGRPGATDPAWAVGGVLEVGKIVQLDSKGNPLQPADPRATPPTGTLPLYSIYGIRSDDIWAVGKRGTVLWFNAWGWQTVRCNLDINKVDLTGLWVHVDPNTGNHYISITGYEDKKPENSWAIGFSCEQGHEDVCTCSAIPGKFPGAFSMVSGVKEALHGGTVQPYAVAIGMNAGAFVYRKWNPTLAFALQVADDVYVPHVPQGVGNPQGIWGGSGSELWVVTDRGTLLHYQDEQWTVQQSGTKLRLTGVWGGGDGTLWTVGATGTDASARGAVLTRAK